MCNNTILKDKRRLSSNTYTLSITKRDTNVQFLNYLYKDSTIYLNRKYERYLLLQNGAALIQNIVFNYNENN